MSSFYKILSVIFLFLVISSTQLLALDVADWTVCPYAQLENEQILHLQVSPENALGQHLSVATIDLTAYQGQYVTFSIRARISGIEKDVENKSQRGFRFLVSYTHPDGYTVYHHSYDTFGTADWKTYTFLSEIGTFVTTAQVQVGIQNNHGEIWVDLNSFAIDTHFPAYQGDDICTYSDEVRNASIRRGITGNPRPTLEKDFQDLQRWNVNLYRYWFSGYRWDFDGVDLTKFRQRLDARLEDLDQACNFAKKYGIKIVPCIGTPPGGRSSDANFPIYENKELVDLFVASWEKIAQRYKGNSAIWAYDLLNEPNQTGKVSFDYLTIQELAATAIRKIDPDTPILIESNLLASPRTFSLLRPLALKNIIYQAHMYVPEAYTHSTIGEYPGTFHNRYYDKETLRQVLAPVRAFQQRHQAIIYIGEFSVRNRAVGADKYLSDCIELFEEYGWNWTYHSFREAPTWSLEHEFIDGRHDIPSTDNPRKQVLLAGWELNKKTTDKLENAQNSTIGLETLPWTDAAYNWTQHGSILPRINTNLSGTGDIVIAGQTYKRGIVGHTGFSIVYQIDQLADSFSALVGIDEEKHPKDNNDPADLFFTIVVDQEEVWRQQLSLGDAPVAVTIDLKGKTLLELRGEYGKANFIRQRVAWVNPDLVTSQPEKLRLALATNAAQHQANLDFNPEYPAAPDWSKANLKIDKITWNGFKSAYQIDNGKIVFTLVPEMGGRIVSFSLKDEKNLLKNSVVTGETAVIRGRAKDDAGGHFVRIQPFKRFHPSDPILKHGCYSISFPATGEIILKSAESVLHQVVYEYNIKIAAKDDKITIVNKIVNIAPYKRRLGIWSITRLASQNLESLAILPEIISPPEAMQINQSGDVMEFVKNPESLIFQIKDNYNSPQDFAEILCWSEKPEIVATGQGNLLKIAYEAFSQPLERGIYPIHLYISERFIEIESHSPALWTDPGKSVTMSEVWTAGIVK